MKPKVDLLGKKIGRLMVLSVHGRGRKGLTEWKCQCSCGAVKIVRSDLLISGKTKSCGCLRKLPFGEGNFNAVYLRYRRQAAERNILFSLTKEDVKQVTSSDCYYCGVPPQQKQDARGSHGVYVYNGIDRKDSLGGYTSDNVVPCCIVCNRAKHAMGVEQFKRWVERIYRNLFKKVSGKTPGELIDALITTNIKCFMFQEKMLDQSLSESDRVQTGELVVALNKKRCHLTKSIDALLDFTQDTVTPKTYLSDQKDNSNPEF